jgi:protein O-GlcNAc transferase
LFTFANQAQDKIRSSILYARALDACTFIQEKIICEDGRLIRPLTPKELPRLQKVLFTSATIQSMNPSSSMLSTATYFRALELVISPHQAYIVGGGYSTRDLILGSFLAAYMLSTPPGGHLPTEIADSLSLPHGVKTSSLIDASFNLLDAVRSFGDRFLNALLTLGNNALPFMLLLPEQAAHLPGLLFPSTSGVLPAICTALNEQGRPQPPSDAKRQEATAMTGSILLALAKRYQDLPSTEVSIPGFSGTLNVNHSLAMILYYLALALSPSPSTYNNMGIILSVMSTIKMVSNAHDDPVVLSGSSLAQIYYTTGLQLDPSHPHLLTNLGSLYKDQGNLEEAVK